MRIITFFGLLIGIIILVIILNSLPQNNDPQDTAPMSSSSVPSFKDYTPYSSKPLSSSLSSSPQMSSSSVSSYQDTSIKYEATPNTRVASQEVITKPVAVRKKAVVAQSNVEPSTKPSTKSSSLSPKVVASESAIVASPEPIQEQSQSSQPKSSSSSSIAPEKQSWAKHYEGIESVPDTLPANVLVISKSKQTFSLIRDNKEVLTGDVTTGGHFPDPTGGWSETHAGVYWVSNKSRNVKMELFGTPDKVSDYFISLRGRHNVVNATEEYVGIHDSPWRSKFGSEFDYKGKGTNGCITAPSKLVEQLFGMMQVNDLVYIVD